MIGQLASFSLYTWLPVVTSLHIHVQHLYSRKAYFSDLPTFHSVLCAHSTVVENEERLAPFANSLNTVGLQSTTSQAA